MIYRIFKSINLQNLKYSFWVWERSGRVGSGRVKYVGNCGVGSDRVGSSRVGSGRIWSGQVEFCHLDLFGLACVRPIYVGSSRVRSFRVVLGRVDL